MEKEIINEIVPKEVKEQRLDQFLNEHLGDFSRSYIQKMIKGELVTVNEKIVKKTGFTVFAGDCIEITLPEIKEVQIKPEQMDLDIIYEDSDVILVNKPKGMVVHPAPGHYTGTLVNGLLYHCRDNLSGINGELRPGIVHRIDMDTTGILIVCKNDLSHQKLSEQLSVHSITRKYNAIVHNNFTTEAGTIDAPIGRNPIDRKKMAVNVKNSRRAVTHYKVLDHLNLKYNYLECQLETGRTHQIRVHMASINHQILGDAVYGNPSRNFRSLQGQTLHARTLGFIHPTKNEYMEFEAPLPEYFNELLQLLTK